MAGKEGVLTSRWFTGKRERPPGAVPRVGLFGLFGSGNTGNDGSLEAMLAYLRSHHPDAILDVKCPGPNRVKGLYGVDATFLQWYTRYANKTSGLTATALKVLGKAVDAFRMMSWVRKHDVVIVPGTGILESTLPLRASGTPYNLFLLCTSGRLWGTKVALVSVGASVSRKRLTRSLFATAARLAFYRSYRDHQSRDAMKAMGVDTTHDHVFPDLAFSLHVPTDGPGDERNVGICVMAFYGGTDDRQDPDEIYATYLEKMKCFVRWLVETTHHVKLFWGDDCDKASAQEILDDVRALRPDLASELQPPERLSSLGQLLSEMSPVGTVVATRYHNVLCGLKLCKPTISIGYSAKHDALMTDMLQSEFAEPARTFDVDRLKGQFAELQRRSSEIRLALAQRNLAKAAPLDQQFALLSSLLFPPRGPGEAPEAVTSAGRQFA